MTEPRSEESYRLEGVAFGLADGLIMCLGLVIGVAEATSNTQLVLITGIIGGFANAFGNAIGFYMSQSAERALQIHETTDHGVTTRIHSTKEILLNSVVAFASSVIVVLVLLAPFPFLSMGNAVVLTFIMGTILAFILGGYIGRISHGNPYATGGKYAILAIVGAVISHIIADLIQLFT